MSKKDIVRQKTLLELDLLNKESEQMFDDITELASKICNMPIALVTILDLDKQLFKSRFGTTLTETPIEQAFCKIAVENPHKMLSVEDARKHPRFMNNPLVYDTPNIVSYYGMPFKAPSGVALGTLCLIDYNVNILSDAQKDLLKTLSKHLEYLIDLRAKTKAITSFQAKLAQETKDMEDFTSIAVHDLKAPVRAINSFTKLLQQKHQKIWDEKDQKYMGFILESTLKMNELINNLLEYSKHSSKADDIEEFDLKALVQEIFNDLTIDLKEQPVLTLVDLPKLITSKVLTTALFTNLLANAIKFKKEGRKTEIIVSAEEIDEAWVFKIQDNGIGIESDYFEYIFKPFKRLHTNSTYPGNGLGLAICNKIVSNLEGTISVTSTLGEETCFTVTLPKKLNGIN